MLRLFFGLHPDAEQGAALVEHVRPLTDDLKAQRVPPENLHVTLCFVGAVAPEKLLTLRAAAASVRGSRVALRFDALEHWEKPKVLCATAMETSEAAPARALATALAAATIDAGFAPDVKPLRPHLTLARKVDAACAAALTWPRPLDPALLVHCERFVLMESRRAESGSTYSVVDSWPLDAVDPN